MKFTVFLVGSLLVAILFLSGCLQGDVGGLSDKDLELVNDENKPIQIKEEVEIVVLTEEEKFVESQSDNILGINTNFENVLEYVAGDVQFVIGSNTSMDDYIIALDLYSETKKFFELEDDSEALKVAFTDSEVSISNTQKNVVIIGNSCTNTLAAELNELPPSTCGTESSLSPGAGKITLFDLEDEKVALLIEGWNSTEIKAISQALINGAFKGNACMINGITSIDQYEKIICI
jgi:hypothetical protein